MVKIFVTGDNHIGKKYDRFPEVKEKLVQSRFDALDDMVKKAEDENCDLFVVTGDLFDSTNGIKIADVKKVVDILSSFNNNVIVIPGNHDYFTGDEKVWSDFETALISKDHNIKLLNEFKPYQVEASDDKVVIYPAYCQSKHSKDNNLKWINDSNIDTNVINIGVSHGAIKGITPDMKEEYFLMTEKELNSIPMDAWLIGHTHIPYPNDLKEGEDKKGYRIFNAGTHEQTDYSNSTEGIGFIISINKKGNKSDVLARKYVSGKIHFCDIEIPVKPNDNNSLKNTLTDVLKDIDSNSIVRINVSGSIKQTEYQNKETIYKEVLSRFLTYEKNDSELSEEITIDKIRSDFAETSFAAKFMEELIDNPAELQMAYELLNKCKE